VYIAVEINPTARAVVKQWFNKFSPETAVVFHNEAKEVDDKLLNRWQDMYGVIDLVRVT
jgi:hypothetical protein